MILMQVNNLVKRFGAETILENIKLEIQSNDRIAIVGRNGAGKSTLLKIMAGVLSFDEGEIHRPKDVSLGYLDQNTGLETSETIWAEMLEVFSDLIEEEKALRSLEEQMGDPSIIDDETRYQQLLNQYDTRQQAFKVNGGYQYEAEIRTVLNGLHFTNYDFATSISELSGGQKTRLALGKLLLAKPDILILDEPTNHLDIETLTWLENYLNNYAGAVVIVSHDRYFLDKTIQTVYEISRQRSKKYHGNYSKYLEQKALDYEREQKMFEKQQSEIKKLEDFVQKNLARASTTKRAQSRRKQLEKIDRLDRPKGDESSASFSFQINKRSGNDVLKIDQLAFRYPDDNQTIFSNISFSVTKGERIALVGPNGVGKTTLLKTIIGDLSPASGSLTIGTNVQIGYYDQEQAKLHSTKTVLMELWDEYPSVNEKDIRTVLGNFLFSGDDVLKPVSALSGGEKARLALAKLMMEKANLLILDEPTNHLDLDSKEVLEAALLGFPGTIIFVSHDRYFINEIATQVIEQQATEATVYLGDYDYYVEKKQESIELAEWDAQKREKQQQNNMETKTNFHVDKQRKQQERKTARRIAEIEETIEELEENIANNEALLCEPEVFQDHEKTLELTKENDRYTIQIEQLMEEWETLQIQ
ncbi:ATP-binding cassette subfamily F protein 3 [Natronobacillus azotifigens]|uniref:ABC-F family ATP-binding cassette domain-containing protein n=1 Tax=Natronobacillus azotifigens TaxID=472978 RepID=A0A9J6RFK7_9BACI|nr:ABC-F family ATP-binding cassette domain-containing protein [Natronobacillus azotifigens]MCZ0704188.1 ABC-F family ATP-binding cassette domain-containing protein [Natronobacillus azotifigens]